ncbi:hypothetical protein PHLCEN_2v2475 [Hermanssonia centrifuga]|uniref:Uncharacterized protein n=1 Tax=Hermanssonia centrifuga TaxID=98765 RepID=A0A2R6RLT0_9APHY|nr:hypothetical protein PHLCEN_2v2475 [Hermanssonia centrifuga]
MSSKGPKNDPKNPLHYIPTNSYTAVAVEYLLVTLAPCGFIASEYILLGRLATLLKSTQHLLIPARRIIVIFVIFDVTTFLIQAGGGGIVASAGSKKSQGDLGSNIFLAGLIIQLISFFIFSVIYLRFLFLVHEHERAAWLKDEGNGRWNDWRTLAFVRSFYRVIELTEGFAGTLTTTESYFFLLDALPLFCAIAVYVPFWPGRFIPSYIVVGDEKSADSERGHYLRTGDWTRMQRRYSNASESALAV